MNEMRTIVYKNYVVETKTFITADEKTIQRFAQKLKQQLNVMESEMELGRMSLQSVVLIDLEEEENG